MSDRLTISFFSGAMGLDLGLEAAGLDIALGQDIDKACIETAEANGRREIFGDIRDITPQEIMREVGLGTGEAFMVCGGPPCQPFSTAGKRLGVNDPRGSLFMDYVRMIDGIRPRFFVMENVKGLVSAPLGKDAPKGMSTALDIVVAEFEKLGYRTVYGLLDAVNYGTPQFRERFVMIGSRDGENVFMPMPTRFQTHQEERMRWATAGSAIRDLEEDPGECASFGPSRTAYLELVPEGGNWKNLPPDVAREAMGGAYESGGGKVGFYRRISYAEPSPTLTTSPVQKATMLGHPTKARPLSVSEYKRLQQFPDNWHIAGSTADKYRQIGNAVPVGLGEAIGKAILSVADGVSTVKTKRVRGTSVHSGIIKAMTLGGFDSGN